MFHRCLVALKICTTTTIPEWIQWSLKTRPEVIKLFSCSAEHEFCPAYKSQITNNSNFFLLNIAEHEIFSANKYENEIFSANMSMKFSLLISMSMKFSLLINMKMPTIVGIFIFISRENFMLSWVEYEKSFITSGPENINSYTSEVWGICCDRHMPLTPEIKYSA